MIVRIFTGHGWAGAVVFDDANFDVVPRKGEKLALDHNDQWAVPTVIDVVHRVTGDEAADVALLVTPVQQSPHSDEALPFAVLDGVEGPTATSVPQITKPSPWER